MTAPLRRLPGAPNPVVYATLSVVLALGGALSYVALSAAGAAPRVEPEFSRLFLLPIPSSPSLMYLASLSLAGAMLGAYMYGRRMDSVEERLDRQLYAALRVYHTVAEASGSPQEAVRLLRTSIGEEPLYSMLSSVEALMSRGSSMEEAFRAVFSPAPRHLRMIAQMLPVAQRGGARMREVLEGALSYAREISRMRRSLANRLAPYRYVLLMANLLFSSVAGVTIGLIDLINRGGLAPGFRAAVGTEDLTALLWFSSLIVALASSLIAGRIIRGKALLGGLFASVFVTLNTLVIINLPRIVGALA